MFFPIVRELFTKIGLYKEFAVIFKLINNYFFKVFHSISCINKILIYFLELD